MEYMYYIQFDNLRSLMSMVRECPVIRHQPDPFRFFVQKDFYLYPLNDKIKDPISESRHPALAESNSFPSIPPGQPTIIETEMEFCRKDWSLADNYFGNFINIDKTQWEELLHICELIVDHNRFIKLNKELILQKESPDTQRVVNDYLACRRAKLKQYIYTMQQQFASDHNLMRMYDILALHIQD